MEKIPCQILRKKISKQHADFKKVADKCDTLCLKPDDLTDCRQYLELVKQIILSQKKT